MRKTNIDFANGLIDALKSPYAQGRIEEALGGSEAQLSRVFDIYAPSSSTAAEMYQQTMDAAGEGALSVSHVTMYDDEAVNDAVGQQRLEINLTSHMREVSADLAETLLTPNGTDLKTEVKAAIGPQYLELEKKYGKEAIIKYLMQAALVSYSQPLTREHGKSIGLNNLGSDIRQKLGLRVSATEEQLRSMENFGFNISGKLNDYPRNIDPNYFKATNLERTINKSITELEKYRSDRQYEKEMLEGELRRCSPNSPKQKELQSKIDSLNDKIRDLDDTIDSFKPLRNQLHADLDAMRKKNDYSNATLVATLASKQFSSLVETHIIKKPALIELHNFFEKILSSLYSMVGLTYLSNTQKAVADLKSLTQPDVPISSDNTPREIELAPLKRSL